MAKEDHAVAERGMCTIVKQARQFVALEAAGSQSDRELLDQWVRRRDEAAFTILVQRHARLVLGVCRRVLRHGQDAEDASQATFLVLARTAASIRKRTALASWLHGVAYRLSQKMYTAQMRRRVREDRAAGERSCNPAPDPSWREVQEALDEALNALPAKYSAPLVLCYLEERTRDEAAQQLALPLSTLRGRLERGRDMVRANLARQGITLSGGLILAALTADAGAVPASFAAAAMRVACGRVLDSAAVRIVFLADGAMKTVALSKIGIPFALLVLVGLGAAAGMLGQPSDIDDVAAPATHGVQLVAAQAPPPQPGARVEGRDRRGDPLPPRVIARLGTVRFRPGGWVDSLAFTPDGNQLVAFGQGTGITVWDAASGKELLRHNAGNEISAALLAPDGRTLVTQEGGGRTGAKQSIRIRDRANLKVIREFAVESLRVPRLTRDGKQLIALREDDRSHIDVWDIEAGRRVRSWQAHEERVVYRLDLARDGKTVATAAEKVIRVWDVPTGRLIREFGALENDVKFLALAPNGKLVASAVTGMGSVKFGPINLHRFADRIRIWDVDSGKAVSQLHLESSGAVSGKPPEFFTALFSPDGKQVVTTCSDRMMRIWDARTGKLQRQLAVGHNGATVPAFSPDGETLAIGGAAIRLLDWATGKDKHQEFGYMPGLEALAVAPDGLTVATCAEGPIQLWDAASGEPRRRLAGHDPAVINHTTLRILPDGKTVLSAGTDKTFRLWDLRTGKERGRMDMPAAALPLAITDDGATVALRDDSSIRLIQSATGKERLRVPGGDDTYDTPPRAAFTADGRILILWEHDHTVRVWDVAAGKEVRQFKFPERPSSRVHEFYSAAVAPDGRVIAYGRADGYLAIHEMATGKLVRLVEGLPPDNVRPLSFSPDGRSLAWCGDQQPAIQVLELASGRERLRVSGHQGSVRTVTYSADGRTFVSAGLDTTALVWDVWGLRAATKAAPLDEDAAWRALAHDDARVAYAMMCRLAAAPNDAVALLRRRLAPIVRPDERRIAKLLVDLDSEVFAVRDAAQMQLAQLDETAVPTFRAALQSAKSIELRRRVEGLIDKHTAETWTMRPERLRLVRSVEVLETAGAAECRALLKRLADGAPGHRLTEEAIASLRRLTRR